MSPEGPARSRLRSAGPVAENRSFFRSKCRAGQGVAATIYQYPQYTGSTRSCQDRLRRLQGSYHSFRRHRSTDWAACVHTRARPPAGRGLDCPPGHLPIHHQLSPHGALDHPVASRIASGAPPSGCSVPSPSELGTGATESDAAQRREKPRADRGALYGVQLFWPRSGATTYVAVTPLPARSEHEGLRSEGSAQAERILILHCGHLALVSPVESIGQRMGLHLST